MAFFNQKEVILVAGCWLLDAGHSLPRNEQQATSNKHQATSNQPPMLLRLLYDEKLAQASYLIGCQRTGEALVLDPERDVQRYLDLAAKEGLRITAIAETHIHADFLSGTRELAEQTGARLYLSDEGDADWKYFWLNKKAGGEVYAHQLLQDGDRFKIGMIEMQALHTPGHTPEHLCFLLTDHGGGATKPMGIFTGDFVFVGDVGRPDLLETAAGQVGVAQASAQTLYHSLRRFMELPDYLQLWPGHGSGSFCGKSLGSVLNSTVGYEKLFNASLRAAQKSEAAFVEEILEGQMEPPFYFGRMKHENKFGPALLRALPQPRACQTRELLQLDPARAVIIDTRPWADYCAGHLPNALHLPLTNDFPTLAGSYIKPEQMLYLVINESRVAEAVAELVRVGLDHIAGYITPENLHASQRLLKLEEISAESLQHRLAQNEVLVLDVRTAFEYELGHLPDALNIAHTRLLPRLAEIPRERPLVVHCQKADRSPAAAAMLAQHGFQVYHLAGGLRAWYAAGYEAVME